MENKTKITRYSIMLNIVSLALLIIFEWELSTFAICGLCILTVISVLIPLILHRQLKYLIIIGILILIAMLLPCF